MYLEGRGLADNTINQRLAPVRRLAYQAIDAGLLGPELAAGISQVRGIKQLGHRSRTGSASTKARKLKRAAVDELAESQASDATIKETVLDALVNWGPNRRF
jgi:hypothetical protein